MAETRVLSSVKTQFSDNLQDNSENIPLLPRSAWKSQITYLKVLLKAKQVLDSTNL